jgi:hypothetical protein
MTTCNKCSGLNNAGFPKRMVGDLIRYKRGWWRIETLGETSCFARQIVHGALAVGESKLIYYTDIKEKTTTAQAVRLKLKTATRLAHAK